MECRSDEAAIGESRFADAFTRDRLSLRLSLAFEVSSNVASSRPYWLSITRPAGAMAHSRSPFAPQIVVASRLYRGSALARP